MHVSHTSVRQWGLMRKRVGERVTYWVLKLSKPCRPYSRRGRFCCTSLLAVSQKKNQFDEVYMQPFYFYFLFLFIFVLLVCVCVCVWGGILVI